jgi:hypothetical protein
MAFTNLEVLNNGRIQCFGFDNPGSLNIVQRYLKQSGKNDSLMDALAPFIHNIQADVNVINTCNPQWGAVYRVLRWDFNYGESARALLPVSSCYMFNYHYLTVYSINDQHQKVLAAIINGYSLRLFKSSPAGFSAGYKGYIDGEDRKEYWTQYFKYCWNIDADIRDTYKDFDKFAVRMFADLKKALDESSLVIDEKLLESADEELINLQASNA